MYVVFCKLFNFGKLLEMYTICQNNGKMTSLVAQMVKNLLAVEETQVQFLQDPAFTYLGLGLEADGWVACPYCFLPSLLHFTLLPTVHTSSSFSTFLSTLVIFSYILVVASLMGVKWCLTVALIALLPTWH